MKFCQLRPHDVIFFFDDGSKLYIGRFQMVGAICLVSVVEGTLMQYVDEKKYKNEDKPANDLPQSCFMSSDIHDIENFEEGEI